MVQFWDPAVLEEGSERQRAWMMEGGRESRRPRSFTDTGNAWPHIQRNTHSGLLVFKVELGIMRNWQREMTKDLRAQHAFFLHLCVCLTSCRPCSGAKLSLHRFTANIVSEQARETSHKQGSSQFRCLLFSYILVKCHAEWYLTQIKHVWGNDIPVSSVDWIRHGERSDDDVSTAHHPDDSFYAPPVCPSCPVPFTRSHGPYLSIWRWTQM